MKASIRLFALGLFGLFSLSSSAAPGTGGYTLQECFDAALKRSEVIATQQELITQAEEHVRQATGGILPTISGLASRRWQETPQSGTGSAISPPVQDQVNINLSQPLFRGLREFAALRQTKALRQASVDALRNAELSLFRDVSQSFYTVVALERDLADIRSELKFYDQRVSELEKRIRIGRSRVSERLTVEAAAAALNAQSEALVGQIAVAREVLAFQTGLPQDAGLKDSAQAPSVLPQEQYLAKIEQRPDVRTELARVTAAEEAVSVARGAHFPSLDLTGNYYLVRPGVLSESHWDVALGLTLPIYAGGTIQSRVREAASLQSQEELALNRVRRAADQEIRSAYTTVQADQRQIQALETALRLADRNYQQQSKEYSLGLVTNLDVLQALTASLEARRSLDRARFSLKNDLVRLELAAGSRP